MVEYLFECPHCRESTVVDDGARRLLVDCGCIVCGRPVSSRAFERRASAGGR
ncbi:MAG: hypothetical protein ABEI77_09810 [Halorientalis sp.]